MCMPSETKKWLKPLKLLTQVGSFDLGFSFSLPLVVNNILFKLFSLIKQTGREKSKLAKFQPLNSATHPVGQGLFSLAEVRKSSFSLPTFFLRYFFFKQQNLPHVLCVDTCLLYTSPSPRDS
eukprot:TRINITY_DN2858_c0_g1_i17.p4 TRINITY_DN2858_c0_g1~~TRINITY_DN2858_c0_g1_i17.p4  ORF type:complete len:122 (-),score=10.30 TRINITY_DN2858_c0_g1_i17:54-419(-)